MRGRSGLVLGARRRSEGREKSGTASQFASGRALFFKGHTGGRIGGSPHFSLPCDFCHGLLGAVRRFALLLLAATAAYPHDIWLVPDRSSLSKGDTLVVRQVVGSELEVEMELEVLRRMTPRFELITRSGSVDLMKELPDMRTRPVVKPVFERKLDFEGPALLAMDHAFIHGAFRERSFSNIWSTKISSWKNSGRTWGTERSRASATHELSSAYFRSARRGVRTFTRRSWTAAGDPAAAESLYAQAWRGTGRQSSIRRQASI